MKKFMLFLLCFIPGVLFAQVDDELIKNAYNGDLEAVKKNVTSGASVNYKNDKGQTPLAVAYMYPDITEFLLSKGADPNAGDFPALVSASRLYSLDVMKLLLKAGADPNKNGVVNVDVAAPIRKMLEDEKAKGKKGNKYLVKAYEDQLEKMPKSNTMTFTAMGNVMGNTNCRECAEILFAAGAKTDFKNGITGGNLMHELASNYIPAEQRAASLQAYIPYFDKAGVRTPDWFKTLDVASFGTANDMVKLLKSKGVDMEALDNNKWTPLKQATNRATGHEEIIIALIDNGADVKATGLSNDVTEFAKETAELDKVKVKYDFPREGRNSNGSGYSANMDLVNPKPKKVALISYYLYDPGKGKVKGGAQSATVSASVWRTPDGKGQDQVDGFYKASIDALKGSFKENGVDLLTPFEFLDTEEKIDFYFGFSQESAKKEKTTITKRNATGGFISEVASASVSTLKVSPSDKGYRHFFIANEGDDESMLLNFQQGIFSANRKLTSSLGYELAKGLGVDAVVVVYICTRKLKMNKEDYGVNAVVTMMLGPNPGRNEKDDADAKNLGQFYCGTRTYYGSPAIFKQDNGIFSQYSGMANVMKAHAAKMCKYVNGKEKDEE